MAASGGLYGKERVILELMRQQARQGLVPQLVNLPRWPCPPRQPILEAVRAIGLPATSLAMRTPVDLWRLARAIRAWSIDLVHVHDYKGSLTLAALRPLGLVPPLVRTLHRTRIRTVSRIGAYELLDCQCWRWHDRLVAVTAAIQAETQLEVGVIENGISPPDATAGTDDPDLEAVRTFHRDGELVLGALTRLSPEKNLGALVDAVARLNASGLPTRLVMVGEGPGRAALAAHVQALGIADRVLMPGFKDPVAPWLALFDFYVQSSRSEGAPIALLEAMYAGRPLLVTPIAGMKDLLAQGAAIEIPFDGPGIAEVVRRHATSAHHRAAADATAVTARRLVGTRYTAERMAAEYRAVYKETLGRRSATPAA